MNRPMELDIWTGDWGLASIDVHCLEVLAYAKFSSVPLQTHVTNNPFRTPNGTLPVFRCGNKVFCEYEEISAYLRQKNFSSDFGLTPRQCSEVKAYSQLLKEKLYPGLQYIWWIDNKNYTELTRKWYAKTLPFPFNYFYPGKYEKDAKKVVEAVYELSFDDPVLETKIYSEAEKCITALSCRLAENDFFFGSHPTSLDATVYAYLAPLLKAPFPNATLQNHLKACNNLVKYVVRISQRYFTHVLKDYETKRTAESAHTQLRKDSEAEFPHKLRNKILAGLFATTAMAGYAFSTGLIEVSIKQEDKTQEQLIETEIQVDDEKEH